MRIELGVDLERCIETIDGAEVEELLDEDQDDDQGIVNQTRALRGVLDVVIRKLPWICEY